MTGGWTAFRRRWQRPARDIALLAGFLVAVSYLPADTSLAERQSKGFLRYCVANPADPLVQDPETGAPGPEQALLARAAAASGLQLQVIGVSNIGRSFNPANWNVSRGQCDVLGGGFADTPVNRGFMTLIPTGQRIALQLTGDQADLPPGSEVGVFAGAAGLDRIRLSGWMRAKGWRAIPLRRPADLTNWLTLGKPAVVSTLSPLPPGTKAHELPPEAGQATDLVLGMWRGDTTLTRSIREAIPQG